MLLKHKIESILFISDRAVSAADLEKITGAGSQEIINALSELESERKDAGIILLRNNNRYLFSTHPENSELVKNFLNAELREKLSDASLETLSIIAYKQPASRAEIESIRGVNSQYTIRLLMMRGLIEKISTKGIRGNLYQITHEFLQHMGLHKISDLPDFEELTSRIKPPEGYSQEV